MSAPAQTQAKTQATAVAKAALDACAFVSRWALWFGRLVVAIGIAYAAARIFSIGWLSIEGIRLPYPKVASEALNLLYLAGCIYLVTK